MNEIVRLLSAGERFALICHKSPDGDTLGSAMALALGLRQLGKSAEIFCQMAAPHTLRDLPLFDEVHTEPAMEPGYTAVAVDCADEERMGSMAELFRAGTHRLNIDHHVTNTRYGEANLVDPTAGAAGEIIWDVLKALGVQPNREIALCAYIAVATDTGSFMYSNTTSRSLQVAAETFQQKFDHTDVCNRLFREQSLGRARMIGLCAANLRMFCEGKIALSSATLEEMSRIGAVEEDADGASAFLRDIDTVKAAAFLREVEPGVFKVSMRSKDTVDVCAVAKQFSGGGHVCAAGCTIRGDRETAVTELSAALTGALREAEHWTAS